MLSQKQALDLFKVVATLLALVVPKPTAMPEDWEATEIDIETFIIASLMEDKKDIQDVLKVRLLQRGTSEHLHAPVDEAAKAHPEQWQWGSLRALPIVREKTDEWNVA